MSIAGLSIGGGGLLITLVVLSTVVPLMNRQREMTRRDQCKMHLQVIAAALANYANSNQGRYPDSLSFLVGNGGCRPTRWYVLRPATRLPPARRRPSRPPLSTSRGISRMCTSPRD